MKIYIRQHGKKYYCSTRMPNERYISGVKQYLAKDGNRYFLDDGKDIVYFNTVKEAIDCCLKCGLDLSPEIYFNIDETY